MTTGRLDREPACFFARCAGKTDGRTLPSTKVWPRCSRRYDEYLSRHGRIAMEGDLVTTLLIEPKSTSKSMPKPAAERTHKSKPTASEAPAKKPRKPRATAESMAAAQRDISVSEFFAKN